MIGGGSLGISNVTSRVGDGYDGWIEQAPFDRIVFVGSLFGDSSVVAFAAEARRNSCDAVGRLVDFVLSPTGRVASLIVGLYARRRSFRWFVVGRIKFRCRFFTDP